MSQVLGAPAAGLAAGPYLRDVTETSATVVWETGEAAAGTLYYGSSRDNYDHSLALEPATLQRAVLRDLQPGTLYYYRVEAGGHATPAGDPAYYFRTKPPGAEPFEFAVYADTSSGRNGSDLDHGRVVRSIVQYSHPAFVAVTGDLVVNGKLPDDWRRFFQVEGDLLRNVPIYATLGNNDVNGADLFKRYFTAPRKTPWFSFDYGGCHFIFLEILRGQGAKYYNSFRPGNPQFAWLLDDLRRASVQARFAMVFFHAPVYSPDGAVNQVLLEMLHPLFVKYGVDLVFNGTHSYTRAEKDGLVYFVSGGGGAEILPGRRGRTPEIKEVAYVLHHLRVSVDYPIVTVEVIDTNGSVASAFTYWDPKARGGAEEAGSSITESAIIPRQGGDLPVEVYSLPSCAYCHSLLDKVIPRAARAAGAKVAVGYHPLDIPDNLEKLVALEGALGDRDNELPVVVVGGRVILGGKREIERNLRQTLALAVRGWQEDTPAKLKGEPAGGDATVVIAERFASFKILPVLAAGLLDGVNPCAFTTIIFLLSYLVYLGRKRGEILAAGIAFAAGVFLSYTALGLGLSQILRYGGFFRVVAEAIKYLTLALLVTLGALNLRDYILCRRGRLREASLQLPAFLKRRIHAQVRTSTRRTWLAASSLGLGFAVSLFELACTGQVYLPTIVYMLRVATSTARALGLLIAYNLAFILPLVLVFILTFFGLTAQSLAAFFARRVGAVKLTTALLLFGLGVLVMVT